jgi:hypothetical protein
VESQYVVGPDRDQGLSFRFRRSGTVSRLDKVKNANDKKGLAAISTLKRNKHLYDGFAEILREAVRKVMG